MKRTFLLFVLLAPALALAHEGELIEEHSVVQIALDWIGTQGLVLFGVLALVALGALAWWLLRQK